MPQFRKKPVVINAFRWVSQPTPKLLDPAYVEGQGGGFDELDAWLVSLGFSPCDEAETDDDAPLWVNGDESLTIPTLEGEHRCDIGDWIICGVKRELYPCKPDIFVLTYEPV